MDDFCEFTETVVKHNSEWNGLDSGPLDDWAVKLFNFNCPIKTHSDSSLECTLWSFGIFFFFLFQTDHCADKVLLIGNQFEKEVTKWCVPRIFPSRLGSLATSVYGTRRNWSTRNPRMLVQFYCSIYVRLLMWLLCDRTGANMLSTSVLCIKRKKKRSYCIANAATVYCPSEEAGKR